MANGGGRNGVNSNWSKLPMSAAWAWRLLEGLAIASVLIWLVSGRGERNAAADAHQQQASARTALPAAPAFSDGRALVSGPTAVPASAAAPARVAAAPPSPPAVPAREPNIASKGQPAPAAAPVAPLPVKPTQQLAANIPPPPAAATSAPAASRSGEACPAPEIGIVPLPGGRMQVRVNSPCRSGQEIGVSYDTIVLKRTLPASGTGVFVIDLFASDRKSVDMTFADGTRRVLPAVARDLDRVSKVAIRWRAPVNLDLHVFEHAATAGGPGHVWSQAPSSAEAAVDAARSNGLGHGFLNAFDDGNDDKLEIYTYVHGTQDQGTPVAMALDHETRGSQPTAATCGQGAHAKVEFGITMLSRKGELARASGTFKPARCDQPLAATERFDYALMPVITVQN